MAIYTERTVRVNNNKATMDKDVYIYRGNRNIDIQFEVIEHIFKFTDVNLVERFAPSHAYVTLLTPQKKQVSTGKAEVVDGVIRLTINSGMIDDRTECGDYAIVIDLYDEAGDALLTIPPVENQLHVLDRITEIDDVPDELRFVYDDETGNLDVININAEYESGEIRSIENLPLCDETSREMIAEFQSDLEHITDVELVQVRSDMNELNARVDDISDPEMTPVYPDMSKLEIQEILSSNGNILFKAGTYSVEMSDNTGYIIQSNTRIYAEPKVILSVPTQSSDYTVFKMTDVENVKIEGEITINGDSSTQTGEIIGVGVAIDGGKNVVIDGLKINNIYGNAMNITQGSINAENVSINNISINNALDNGVIIANGVGVSISNLTTCDVGNIALFINIPETEKNVRIECNGHMHSGTGRPLEVSCATSGSMGKVNGEININNSKYILPDATRNVRFNNNIYGPVINFNNPSLFIPEEVTYTGNAIYIGNTNAVDSVYGNVNIISPNLICDGTISGFYMNFDSGVSTDTLSNVSLVHPAYKCANEECKIRIAPTNNITLELEDRMFTRDLTDTVSYFYKNIANKYILPSTATSNITVSLLGLPIGFECEFKNESSAYTITISDTVNGESNLKVYYGEFVKIQRIGANEFIILSDNLKNKLYTLSISGGKINMMNARYQYVSVGSAATIVTPSTAVNFAEYHLFVAMTANVSLYYPGFVKWANEQPATTSGNVYEFIITKVNDSWLIGCVSYV